MITRRLPDRTDRRERFLPFASGGYILRYTLEERQIVATIRVWHSREARA